MAGGDTGRIRKLLAKWLYRLSCWVEPRPEDEDPWSWEVSIVKIAARAESRDAALKAINDVTRHLDVRTIHLVLMLLATDFAHSPDLLKRSAWEWADDREFVLMADRLRQEEAGDGGAS